MLSIFSCACWPSVCLLWRNVYLCLLPIFWLGFFFLSELHKLFVSFAYYSLVGHMVCNFFFPLIKYCSKFSKPGFSNMWTVNFLMFKLVLEKAEEPEMKLPTSSKKQESSRKTSISALLTMPKPLTVWITINCGKFWKRCPPDLPLEKSVCRSGSNS